MDFLELSSILVASFSSMESYTRLKNVLSVDRLSRKLVLSIALALQAVIDKTLMYVTDGDDVPWVDGVEGKKRSKKTVSRQDSSDYSFPEVCGINLADLLPPLSKRKETLHWMLLHLKAEEYAMKHKPLSEVEDGNFDSINDGDRLHDETVEVDGTDVIEADGDAVYRLLVLSQGMQLIVWELATATFDIKFEYYLQIK